MPNRARDGMKEAFTLQGNLVKGVAMPNRARDGMKESGKLLLGFDSKGRNAQSGTRWNESTGNLPITQKANFVAMPNRARDGMKDLD